MCKNSSHSSNEPLEYPPSWIEESKAHLESAKTPVLPAPTLHTITMLVRRRAAALHDEASVPGLGELLVLVVAASARDKLCLST